MNVNPCLTGCPQYISTSPQPQHMSSSRLGLSYQEPKIWFPVNARNETFKFARREVVFGDDIVHTNMSMTVTLNKWYWRCNFDLSGPCHWPVASQVNDDKAASLILQLNTDRSAIFFRSSTAPLPRRLECNTRCRVQPSWLRRWFVKEILFALYALFLWSIVYLCYHKNCGSHSVLAHPCAF